MGVEHNNLSNPWSYSESGLKILGRKEELYGDGKSGGGGGKVPKETEKTMNFGKKKQLIGMEQR